MILRISDISLVTYGYMLCMCNVTIIHKWQLQVNTAGGFMLRSDNGSTGLLTFTRRQWIPHKYIYICEHSKHWSIWNVLSAVTSLKDGLPTTWRIPRKHISLFDQTSHYSGTELWEYQTSPCDWICECCSISKFYIETRTKTPIIWLQIAH